MTRRQLSLILLMIGIIDGLVVGVIVGASASPAAGLAVGFASVAAMFALVAFIGQAIGRIGTWASLRRRYPALEGLGFDRGAKVISLGLGARWMRLNNCIEVMTDDGHLHMRIGLPGTGDGMPLSIPWEAVGSIEETSMGQARLDVEGSRLWLPRLIMSDEMALRESMKLEDDELSSGEEVAE